MLPRASARIAEWREAFGDYSRRIMANSWDDNIMFLAGGLAFSLLLAAIPFVLLLVTGLTFVLGLSPDQSVTEAMGLVQRFLPLGVRVPEFVQPAITDLVASRSTVGLYSALGWVWLSMRLFGSLRTVLGDIFDIEAGHSFFSGKWFDVRTTIVTSVLMLAWIALTIYLAVARARGTNLLLSLGLRQDVMGWLAYAVGRAIAFGFLAMIFFALYKYLPNRRIRTRQALVGAISSAVLLEIARNVWVLLTPLLGVDTVLGGTLFALGTVVFWTYYASLIFILGGEVAQAQELRRVRRIQRARFD